MQIVRVLVQDLITTMPSIDGFESTNNVGHASATEMLVDIVTGRKELVNIVTERESTSDGGN